MREQLVRLQKLYYKKEKQAWFLRAVEIYCDTINSFVADLAEAELKSRGFLGIRGYLTNYAASVRFTTLLSETEELKADLATVQYCVLIKGDKLTVRKYGTETDHSVDVLETFTKFEQDAIKD